MEWRLNQNRDQGREDQRSEKLTGFGMNEEWRIADEAFIEGLSLKY